MLPFLSFQLRHNNPSLIIFPSVLLTEAVVPISCLETLYLPFSFLFPHYEHVVNPSQLLQMD